MSETVAVLDYGMGNLHSAAKALEKVAEGQRIVVTSDPKEAIAADRVVFPGVGAIRDCMYELRQRGLDQAIFEVAASGKPLLGICVGMQALMESSEENDGVQCLGLFPGKVQHFGERYGELGERLRFRIWGGIKCSKSHIQCGKVLMTSVVSTLCTAIA